MSFNQQWVCLCSLYFPIARHGLYSTENILLLSVATAMQCRTEYTWPKTCGEVYHVLKRLPCGRNVLCIELGFLYGCPVSWNTFNSFTGVLMVLCKLDLHLELRLRMSGAITSSPSHAFMVGTRKTSHQLMLNFDKSLYFFFIFLFFIITNKCTIIS